MDYTDWGTLPYAEAWARQETLFAAIIADKLAGRPTQDTFVLCEHLPVYTLGKHGKPENMLLSPQRLQTLGATLVQTDRGGDITFHGPGQVVGYPLFDLEHFGIGLKQYIDRIEETIIRTVAEWGITGERMAGATGVWIDVGKPRCRKIAAIGVRSSHYVTMHGFALNVNTDLRYFEAINPCGFTDKGVTSMAKEIGSFIDIEQVRRMLWTNAQQLFA